MGGHIRLIVSQLASESVDSLIKNPELIIYSLLGVIVVVVNLALALKLGKFYSDIVVSK